MKLADRVLWAGNEAVAMGVLHAGFAMGIGYPGTPSTEILENFSQAGGHAQWAPNEKVALEVATGASYAGARTLVTMKHVGLNIAADPLFSVAHTGVEGAMIIVSADDPGMASSQNEQDNRHYARMVELPMLEPSDSQEAYDFVHLAVEISERWKLPVILRLTTRICHSKTVVHPRQTVAPPCTPSYVRDVRNRLLLPSYAREARRRLHAKLTEIAGFSEQSDVNYVIEGSMSLGIIASGVGAAHAREAAPDATFLKLGITYPLPMERIRAFAHAVDRCVVIEEGDLYLTDQILAAGIKVEAKPQAYRLGEMNVSRVRRILAGWTDEEPAAPEARPPKLCPGCAYHKTFEVLRDLDCIVAGDIGCYTLGGLPPYNAMDCVLCMGASIGMGLGLRHVLGRRQAKRVVSVIGDSTFIHSGITGLIEMAYNPPPLGHVVMILDNHTTAMTGLQEHPGTGKRLDHSPANQIVLEDIARAAGIKNVHVVDPIRSSHLAPLLKESLAGEELVVIIVRYPCLMAAKKAMTYQEDSAVEGPQFNA